MKNIKKLSLLIAIVLIASFVFSFSAFAHDDIKEIEENDKIYAYVPWEYELSVYSDSLCYEDDEGNYLEFCVGENKFAPVGITSLEKGQVQKVFEHFYLYEGDLERTDECFVKYELTEKRKENGYSCYYLQGKYSYDDEDIDGFFAYYFNAYVFATKENIFVVGYEDINGKTEYCGDLKTAVYEIVFNGTHFKNDKPEKNADHDFSNSPAYEDVVLASQGPIFEDGVLGIAAVIAIIMTVVPTLIVIIVAIVLIRKYNKVKKTLRQCELTYGSISQYNAYNHNYGGYGYNQPVNQPYQPPVNPVYQQNPVNQNAPQTPSYVTNAVNNLEGQQPTQPAQSTLPPEMQENQINNENKF
ncbi:MAG: hypothetical protein E7529_01220 [Ruminococcaceae bacterium]|nr:hypothetical protein [Oscillospiraceae bacterium]